MSSTIEKSDIENIVRESTSIKECLEKMGKPSGAGNYKTFYRLVNLYDLDTSHFKQQGRSGEANNGTYIPLSEYVNKPSCIKGSVLIKKLVKEGYKEYKCENPECGLSEWHGKPISLQVHHIDGNHYNNSIDNLMLLCPNCHSQTDSFCGRGRKNKIEHFCEKCGKPIYRDSKLCTECRGKGDRKVKWPDKEQLVRLLKEKRGNFTLTGKVFGVSDNAIRKWCRKYGISDKSSDYK